MNIVHATKRGDGTFEVTSDENSSKALIVNASMLYETLIGL